MLLPKGHSFQKHLHIMIFGSEKFVLILHDKLWHHRASFMRASEKEKKNAQRV